MHSTHARGGPTVSLARTLRNILLHDTRSGGPVPLTLRDTGKAGIYACGPTVYNRIHVGNARPFVVFSLLKRFLEHEGIRTTFAANITDINDKIYVAAREAGKPSVELAAEMTQAYRDDTDGLGLGRPDAEPLATETVPEIIALIEDLVREGHAYAVEGDVYFRVRSLPSYGSLSHRDVDQMDQGEGVEGAALKEDPLDFALWKAQKPDEDAAWESPWGPGRPGWHIECSAMAEKWLGVDFEIHGGGSDLIFPHHENEAAQTEAARGVGLARIWMHNGMLELGDREKMSKSVGNIVGLGSALESVGRDTLLMYFVGGHYRQPIAYSEDVLEMAAARVARFRDAGRALVPGDSPEDMAGMRDAFFDALADDFNTAAALAHAHDWINEANRRSGVGDAHLREMLGVFGLDNLLEAGPDAPADLLDKARRRDEARAARDFAAADALRDEIRAAGWEVRDGPQGPELVPA